MAHVINLTVQAALKTLKADPAEDEDNCRLSENGPRLLPHPEFTIVDVLEKLRRHINIINNRAGWRVGLEKQTIAAGLPILALKLDMPMHGIQLKICSNQHSTRVAPLLPLAHLSMKDTASVDHDYKVVESLGDLFDVFDRSAIRT